MSALRVSWGNIKHYLSDSVISILLLAIAVGILSLLFNIENQVQEKLEKNQAGVDLVIGAKGSPLQILLANLYHADHATGNISLKEANMISKHPMVDESIPLAYGDTYKGFRILGTSLDFTALYDAQYASGHHWHEDFQVVLGASVAKKLGLEIGDHFHGSHGEVAEHVHEGFSYHVHGILKPTGAVVDDLILTTVESVWLVHEEEGHDHHDHSAHEGHHEDEPEEHETHDEHEHHEHGHHDDLEDEEGRELTGLLLKVKGPAALVDLPKLIDEHTQMKAARPGLQVPLLLEKISIGKKVFLVIAIIVALTSALSVFLTLYKGFKKRFKDLVLLRVIGKSRGFIQSTLLGEGLILSSLGFILGLIVSRTALFIINLNMNLSASEFSLTKIQTVDYYLLPSCLALGLFAALVPAFKSGNIDISKGLNETV